MSVVQSLEMSLTINLGNYQGVTTKIGLAPNQTDPESLDALLGEAYRACQKGCGLASGNTIMNVERTTKTKGVETSKQTGFECYEDRNNTYTEQEEPIFKQVSYKFPWIDDETKRKSFNAGLKTEGINYNKDTKKFDGPYIEKYKQYIK